MTQEEIAAQKEQLLADIKKKIGEELETRGAQSKTQVEAIVADKMKAYEGIDLEGLRALATKGADGKTKVEALEEALRTQGTELAELKTRGGNKEDMSIRGQIERWQADNKTNLDAIRAGSTGVQLKPMELRVAATMTNGGSLGGSAYLPNPQREAGVIDLVRVQPTFWDGLTKGATKANPYYWVNKTNKQGNATFIGEGVAKALASFELETETSVPKKVAEKMKASMELLYDLDGIESLITQELRYEVDMACNTAVLTGSVSSTVPAGITTIASAFTTTGIQTTTPNNSDAIRAAIAQIRVLNFAGALTAYINPIDAANMDLQKASDSGVYMLPPFTTADGRRIAGTPVIEDNNIAQGYLLIGDMSKYRILMHQDFFIQWGWENDDFTKNLMTVIGERRFHQFYSANHVGAWIYDTFANIKTGIDAGV